MLHISNYARKGQAEERKGAKRRKKGEVRRGDEMRGEKSRGKNKRKRRGRFMFLGVRSSFQWFPLGFPFILLVLGVRSDNGVLSP